MDIATCLTPYKLTRDEEGNAWDSRNMAGTWILRDNDIHCPGYHRQKVTVVV